MPSCVRPFVGRTLHKSGGVLGAQVKGDDYLRLFQHAISDHCKQRFFARAVKVGYPPLMSKQYVRFGLGAVIRRVSHGRQLEPKKADRSPHRHRSARSALIRWQPQSRGGNKGGSDFHIPFKIKYLISKCGGGSGIRTLGGLSPSSVFKTGAFDHSAKPPTRTPYASVCAAARAEMQEMRSITQSIVQNSA